MDGFVINNEARVFKSGSFVWGTATYSPTTDLEVQILGNDVNFLVGGTVVFTLSNEPLVGPYYFDTSFFTPGSLYYQCGNIRHFGITNYDYEIIIVILNPIFSIFLREK